MKWPVFFWLLLGIAWSAGQAQAPVAPVKVTPENVFKCFKDFKRLTKEPELLDPDMTDLCRPLSPDLVEQYKNSVGPHFRTSVHYYANAAAAAALSRKQKILPEGSVIVKTKEALDLDWDPPVQKPPVTGIGGMIKRAAGYDPDHGDWEYFYADATTPFSTGKLQSCVTCHSKAKPDDFLFKVRDLGE